MAYADFDYYIEEFGGMTISETDFKRFANKASLIMNSFAGGEITIGDDRVKMACCAVAEILNSTEQNSVSGSGGAVASESTGGWSVSYETGTTKSTDDLIYEAVELYLDGLGILSRAVPYKTGTPLGDGWRRS